MPDRIGNLYATPDRKDRKYGPGGRLEEDGEHFYHYDDEGNLIYKELRAFREGVVNENRKKEEKELQIKFRATGTGWRYDWQSNGALRRVVRPDERTIHFRYDALGRRTAKIFNGIVTRWVWDGNVPLHEWAYKAKELQAPPVNQPTVEPTDDITTWVFEAGTFVPAAKIKADKQYSIVTDYLGTPIQMYDEQGKKTWDCTLDIYGKVANFEGSSLKECPFKFQGQYEDEETGLYYNRFRYYEPEQGNYISQDPIGLTGGKIQLYSYVLNPNVLLDILGLRELTSDEIEKLDEKLAQLGKSDTTKGVYNFPNNNNKNYTGSAGTGKGTNSLRDRLMQHMRNDHLLIKDLKDLEVIDMDGITDSDVLIKEAETIRDHGGIGSDNVANRRRPKNTGNVAKNPH